jgi:Protein of unknown function (DUF3592)
MRTIAVYLFCVFAMAIAACAFFWLRRLIRQRMEAVVVSGRYQGHKAHEPEWSVGFRYSMVVDYECPFSGEIKTVMGRRSEQSRDWREVGDPVKLYVSAEKPYTARIAKSWMIDICIASVGFCFAALSCVLLIWKL